MLAGASLAGGAAVPAPGADFGVALSGIESDLSGMLDGGSDLDGGEPGPVWASAGVIASKVATEIDVRSFLIFQSSQFSAEVGLETVLRRHAQ
jgi:hypothetical protein